MRRLFCNIVGGLLCAASLAAQAQTFPTKPVNIIVPFDAGGATDILARLLAVPMSKSFGQQVLIQNKPGAGGRIGAKVAATSQPDGYTSIILASSSTSWTSFYKDPGVDLTKDLTAAGGIVEGSLVIVATSKAPFNTMKEAIDYSRNNPGKVTWSMVSRSSEPMIYMARLRDLGMDMLEIPYKGSAPQAQAVASGEVDFGQFAPGRALALEKAGHGKSLAISGNRRDALVPNVPTMKELGYDGFPNYDFGLMLPAGTPAALVERWNTAMIAALKDPEVQAGMAKFGFHALATTPAVHQSQLQSSSLLWRRISQELKIVPE